MIFCTSWLEHIVLCSFSASLPPERLCLPTLYPCLPLLSLRLADKPRIIHGISWFFSYLISPQKWEWLLYLAPPPRALTHTRHSHSRPRQVIQARAASQSHTPTPVQRQTYAMFRSTSPHPRILHAYIFRWETDMRTSAAVCPSRLLRYRIEVLLWIWQTKCNTNKRTCTIRTSLYNGIISNSLDIFAFPYKWAKGFLIGS